MLRLLTFIAFSVSLTACSDNSTFTTSYEDLSADECKTLGGKLVNGECHSSISNADMKDICKKMGLKYLPEFDGCLSS